MKKELIVQLHASFEQLVHREEESGVEFWLARDLQEVLGYETWRRFEQVVGKAITACQNAGYNPGDHFAEIGKMVPLGSGAEREVSDYMLTRYACYLIAQNGDPTKAPIAFAQTYFAVQTRKQELIEQRLAEVERLSARKKLTASEKELSGIIFERIGDEKSFGRIRSRGDQALFGGRTTQQMKERLNVPDSRPLADFLPTITIKAKDFAKEMNIPVGSTLKYTDDDQIQVRVIDDRHVEHNGVPCSLTKAHREIMKLDYNVQPAPYWTYNGKSLKEIYDDTYTLDDDT